MTHEYEGKELEKHVVKLLEQHGYTIYQRNLQVRYYGNTITEYDIIGYDFIIEVKGGKNNPLTLKLTNQQKNQKRLLPVGYKLYYYFHNLSDQHIKELNDEMNTGRHINNLNVIFQNHKIYNEINIKTQQDFTKFLGVVPIEKVSTINKINIKKYDFFATYYGLNFINNYKDENNHLLSEKVNYIFKNNLFNIVTEFDDFVPTISFLEPTHFLEIVEEHINLNKIWFLKWSADKVQLISVGNQMPIVKEITKLCRCNKVIFDTMSYCGACYQIYKSEKNKKTN